MPGLLHFMKRQTQQAEFRSAEQVRDEIWAALDKFQAKYLDIVATVVMVNPLDRIALGSYRNDPLTVTIIQTNGVLPGHVWVGYQPHEAVAKLVAMIHAK